MQSYVHTCTCNHTYTIYSLEKNNSKEIPEIHTIQYLKEKTKIRLMILEAFFFMCLFPFLEIKQIF